MKLNIGGYDLELTVQEFLELSGELEKPKVMTFDEELHMLQHMRYFKLWDIHWEDDGSIAVTLGYDKL